MSEHYALSPIRKIGWSFAATADSAGEVPHAVEAARSVQIDRIDADDEVQEQMQQASNAVLKLVSTGLWGGGPFSVALSGTANSFYLSVTSR